MQKSQSLRRKEGRKELVLVTIVMVTCHNAGNAIERMPSEYSNSSTASVLDRKRAGVCQTFCYTPTVLSEYLLKRLSISCNSLCDSYSPLVADK